MEKEEAFSEIIQSNRRGEVEFDERLKNFCSAIWRIKKDGSQTNIFSNTYMITGSIGEYYISKILGREFNDKIFLGGDGGKDCIWRDKRISVKSSSANIDYNNGRFPKLLFFIDEELSSDYYVLVSVAGGRSIYYTTIIGWATLEDINKKKVIENGYPHSCNGSTERYVVTMSNLRDSLLK